MNKPESGYTVGRYRDEDHAEVLDDLVTGDYGYKYRMLDGVVMPPYITPDRYRLSRTLRMREGDICFTGFPKSGSTWLAFILVMLTTGGRPPTDRTLRNTVHWVASSFTYPRSREELEAWPSPRIFKSHMPYHMALGGVPHRNPCRYVYIARNPKDVVVSYFHFESSKSWAGDYDGPWEHWLEMFLDGRVQRGSWFDHVLSWWEHRHADNILFITYEQLKHHFEETLQALADFLGYPLDEALLQTIGDRSRFNAMKADAYSDMKEIQELDGFFREGKVGTWRELFSAEQNARFEAEIERRLAGTGLRFDYG